MSKAADDYAYIRDRLSAIEAERIHMVAGTEPSEEVLVADRPIHDWPGDKLAEEMLKPFATATI